MTDVSAADTGSEPVVVTDEESAAARFQDLLHPEEEPAPAQTEAQPEEEAPMDDAEEAEAEPVSTDEGDETDADGDTEIVEVPGTINDLAEQYGVEVNDLAAHLTVKVDGEEVSLKDLRDGHFRRAEYERSKQELVEQRKATEAERNQINGQLAQRLQQMDTLTESLVQHFMPQVDFDRLLDEDPAEYVRQDARMRALQGVLQQAGTIKQQQEEALQSERKANADKYRKSQQEMLVKAVPELTDKDKAASFEKDVGEYLLQSHGFTPEEVTTFIDGTWDHRQILILRDAANFAKFKEGEKKLKKKVKALPKVQKPGSVSDRRSRTQDAKQEARSTMKKRGDDASAEAYVKTLLG